MNRSKNYRIIYAVLVLAVAWCVLGACTPKREAAAADLAMRKAQCAMQNLERSPEQMLIDCAVPRDAKDLQNLVDIFVGAQAGAAKAGARVHPYRDAGAP